MVKLASRILVTDTSILTCESAKSKHIYFLLSMAEDGDCKDLVLPT